MSNAKIAVLVVWGYGALSVLGLLGPLGGIGRVVFGLLVVAHVVEFAVFLPTLRKAPGSLGHHFAQTMLFGVLHYQEVRAASEGADS